jgi:hypothetical protein
MTQISHGWIADERLWLHHVREDVSGGWGGLLEILSLVTLITVSSLAWLGVLAVLIRSV